MKKIPTLRKILGISKLQEEMLTEEAKDFLWVSIKHQNQEVIERILSPKLGWL